MNARLNISQDERGASILIALFYFLVCAVVGAVVLTAATVTTGQLANLEKSQQAYYATSSAAELFRDAIEGGTCTSSGTDPSAAWTCDLPAAADNMGVAAMGTWLETMAASVAADSSADATASATFDIELLSGNVPDGSVPKVSAQLTMNKDYSLHATFRLKDSVEAGEASFVTLDVPAALMYRADAESVERILWRNAVIGKPGAGDEA